MAYVLNKWNTYILTDGNFIAFTATVVVNESISVEENPSDGELSKDADLQEKEMN